MQIEKNEIMEDRFCRQLKRIIEQPDKDGKLVFDQVRLLVQEYESAHTEIDFDRTVPLNSLFLEELSLSKITNGHDTITSGFDEMDTDGVFQLGEYVVIGGRPAMGKTQLLVNLALNMSANVPVLFLSYDLSDSAILKRMIANLTGISLHRLHLGEVNELEKKLIASMEKEFLQRQLFLNDKGYSNISHVRDLCRTNKMRHDVKVVIIDHLQLLGTTLYRNNREVEMSYVSRSLKTIARENNILIIAASQLSRSVEQRGGDKRPQLSDLRESGAIEQDADKVFFLYRPEYYGLLQDEEGNSTQGLSELILAKNRSGFNNRYLFGRDENFTRLVSFKEHLEDFKIPDSRMVDFEEDDKPF
jgi:replicative DNA helicase